MTGKLNNLYKTDEGNENTVATVPEKIVTSKSLINKICRSLGKSSREYNAEKTLNLIESYLNGDETVDRILYSEISNYLFSLNETKRGIFATNAEKLLNHIYADATRCSGDARELIVKIYDHSQLVSHQINNVTNILANSVEDTKKDLKEEVQKDIKGIEKEYITILGIFAAIVLAFVGGITFSSSVLQNMASVSIYRLVLVIDFLGFILVNTIYLLMKFVFVINNHDTEVFKIKTINYILAAIAVLDVIVYFMRN